MDIEGSEWETFKSLLPEAVLPFGQLLIELHFSGTYEIFNFFENMETHGFRVFSRETNHNPCVTGLKPVAVEFSIINPAYYFGGKADAEAAKSIALRPSPPKYNGVIYTLTHKNNMDRLTKMLTSLHKNYNYRYNYPIVVFHEGLAEEDKQILRTLMPSIKVTFRSVEFAIPSWLDKAKIPDRTICSPHSSTVGYRHMCRLVSLALVDSLLRTMCFLHLFLFLLSPVVATVDGEKR